MAKRQPDFTDLTDDEWRILDPLVPPVKRGGRPADPMRREVVHAILYGSRTGCQGYAIPPDLPPCKTVYTYLRNWRLDGTWPRLHDAWRNRTRRAAGRHPQARAAIVDSQSAQTTAKGGRAATLRLRK